MHIVTLGDSLAYGAGDEKDGGIAGRLAKKLDGLRTTNLGVNGAQTGDLLRRLEQQRFRDIVAGADALVLSIGANDLFRAPGAREETMRNPLLVAENILQRVQKIVGELHEINPTARVLILGGYNPVPWHAEGRRVNEYLGMWDEALAGAFEDDPLVSVVRLFDIVTRDRLSRYDNFHPGAAAYAAAADRIAKMLADGESATGRRAS